MTVPGSACPTKGDLTPASRNEPSSFWLWSLAIISELAGEGGNTPLPRCLPICARSLQMPEGIKPWRLRPHKLPRWMPHGHCAFCRQAHCHVCSLFLLHSQGGGWGKEFDNFELEPEIALRAYHPMCNAQLEYAK